MKLYDLVASRGYITVAKSVRGRTSKELEYLLGYRSGTLDAGAFIGVLRNLPDVAQFELAGYSQVADHHQESYADLDVDKLKRMVRYDYWKTYGDHQPVKVFPVKLNLSGIPNEDYPPGAGVPQWKLTDLLNVEIVAFVEGDRRAWW
jgi:hypothetical protein